MRQLAQRPSRPDDCLLEHDRRIGADCARRRGSRAAVEELADGWHQDPETAPLLRNRAINDLDEDVRQAALKLLAKGWYDETTTSVLLDRATNDHNEDVRKIAAEALTSRQRVALQTAGSVVSSNTPSRSIASDLIDKARSGMPRQSTDRKSQNKSHRPDEPSDAKPPPAAIVAAR